MFQIQLDKFFQICLFVLACTSLALACTQTQHGTAKEQTGNVVSSYRAFPSASNPSKQVYENTFSMHRSWPDVPPTFAQGIQAALSWENGEFTWYNDNEELILEKQSRTNTPSTPQPIFHAVCDSLATMFPQGPCALPRLDAALYYNAHTAYFFSGDTYAAFDIQRQQFILAKGGVLSAPEEANPWKNLPTAFQHDLDATVNDGIGNIFFFKGDQYLRYDRFLGTVVEPPTQISDRWPMLPRDFHCGIDAAMRRGRGTVVLFKGGQSIDVSTQGHLVL